MGKQPEFKRTRLGDMVYRTYQKLMEDEHSKLKKKIFNIDRNATVKDLEQLRTVIKADQEQVSSILKEIHQNLNLKHPHDYVHQHLMEKRSIEVDKELEEASKKLHQIHSVLSTEFKDLEHSLQEIKTQQQLQAAHKKHQVVMQTIEQSFGILGNIASLTGNPELGNKLTTVGVSTAGMFTVFAGLEGLGPLAGTHPAIMAILLVAAITSLVDGLSKEQDDAAAQALNDALNLISKKLDYILQQFPIILQMLTKNQCEVLQQFARVHDDAKVIQRKLNDIQAQLHRADHEGKLSNQSVRAALKKLTQQADRFQIKTKIDEIISTIDEAKSFEPEDYHALSHSAGLLNKLYAVIVGKAGCGSSTLTGENFNQADLKDDPAQVAAKLHLHQSPLSPLGSITSYQRQLQLQDCWHPDEVDNVFERLAAKNQAITVHKTVFASQLITPSIGAKKIMLMNDLVDFLGNEKSSPILVVPTLVLANYGLLIVSKSENQILYYGKSVDTEYIKELMNFLTKVELLNRPLTIHYHNISDLGYSDNAAVLFHLFAQLIDGSTKLTLSSEWKVYEKENFKFRQLLVQEDFSIEAPLSVAISTVAIHEYGELFQKLYNKNPDVVSYNNVSVKEIQKLQTILNRIELTRHQLKNISPTFVIYVLERYADAVLDFRKKLKTHLTTFEEEVISPEENTKATEIAKARHHNSVQELLDQSFDVTTESQCEVRATRGQIRLNWWQMTLYAYQRYENLGKANDLWGLQHFYDDRKQNYLRDQQAVTVNIKNGYIKAHPFCEEYSNVIRLFSSSTITTRSLSIAMRSLDKAEVMPAIQIDTVLIPDEYFEAQALGIGKINLAYQVKENKFILKVFFSIENENKYLILEKQIDFNPKFNKGNEGIWRKLMKHYGPMDPNSINLVYVESSLSNISIHPRNEDFYCVTPTMGIVEGLNPADMKEVKREDIHSENALNDMRELIRKHKSTFCKRWSEQVLHDVSVNGSTLGDALASVEVYWQLMESTLSCIFDLSEKNSLVELIKKILSVHSDSKLFVGNKQSLEAFLKNFKDQNCIDFLPKENQFLDVEELLQHYLAHPSKTKEAVFLDEAEECLLVAMKKTMPLVKSQHAFAQESTQPPKSIQDLWRAIESWRNSGCDPSRGVEILNEVYRVGSGSIPGLTSTMPPLLHHGLYARHPSMQAVTHAPRQNQAEERKNAP